MTASAQARVGAVPGESRDGGDGRASPSAAPRTAGRGGKHTPRLSIVIPSYNRRPLLERCIAAISGQTLDPALFEVIVVLDGSTDGSAEALAAMNPPFALATHSQPRTGPGGARNRGVRASRGDYCLFVDDDVCLEPQAAAAHLEMQDRLGGAIVVGRIVTPSAPPGFPGYFVEFWRGRDARLGRGEPPTYSDCFTGNLSVPAGRLMEEGGFLPSLPRGEDVELAFRLSSAGLRIAYAADAAAHQDFRKRTRDCLRDAYREGRAAAMMFRRNPDIVDELTLGGFRDLSRPAHVLVRILARLPLPPMALLEAVGRLPAHRLSRPLFRLVHGHAYLRGIAAHATTDEWRELTRRRG